MSIEAVLSSSYLILCRTLLLLFSIFPSIRISSSKSALLIRWPNYWSFTSPSVLLMNIQGWLPLRLTSLIFLLSSSSSRFFSSTSLKVSILLCSGFFIVQLSHLYSVNTGKTITLSIWTFVSKVMSLLFNMLSRFAIAFLPRRKCLLISLAAFTVCSDFGAQENKICHFPHIFPI